MDVLNVSSTEQMFSDGVQDEGYSVLRQMWTGTKVLKAVVSLLGLVGNLLSYKAAHFMPRSNSSVLMRYLAVWDSIAVVHVGLLSVPLNAFNVELFVKNVRL